MKPFLYRWVPLPFYLALALAFVTSGLSQPRPSDPALTATFVDIGRVTPETRYYDNPLKKPEYGILAEWVWGHHLNYLSRRPNVANPFGGTDWYLRGVHDSYRFLLAESETEAVSLCEQVEARYILASPVGNHLKTLARYLGLLRPESLNGADPENDLRLHYECIMSSRLLLRDGLADDGSHACGNPGPLEHFRLIYESAYQAEDNISGARTSFFKLFELVKGVHLIGRAKPGEKVWLEIPVRTNQRRDFVYRQEFTADSGGKFEAWVPYQTRESSQPRTAAGPCRVYTPGRMVELHFSEVDVLQGSDVQVDLTGDSKG
jgi:dolichyl-diphosphooligosaccharide--protein glycosyltransferase